MADIVKFYRGSESVYVNKWKAEGNSGLQGVLFFDPIAKHIWYNGVQFGVNTAEDGDLKDYATQAWVDDKYSKAFIGCSLSTDVDSVDLSFKGADGNYDTTINIPLVGDNAGLMSPTDAKTLSDTKTATATNADNIATLNERLNTAETKLAGIEEGAEVNVINEVRIDKTPLTIETEGINTKFVNIQLSDKIKELVGIQVGTAYVFMGSVETYEDLANVSDPAKGHVYNVKQKWIEYNEVENTETGEVTKIETGKVYPEGTNFAYNGENWDALGGMIDFTPIEESITSLETSVTSLNNRLTDVETAIGGGSTEGESLNGRVTALEDKVTILNRDVNTAGSVANTSNTIATEIVTTALTWEELE